MNLVSIVPIGEVARGRLELLAEGLARRKSWACSIESRVLEAGFAYNPLRSQYHSTEILKRLGQNANAQCWRVLGVTEFDLFIPILTFVFGEAQLDGPVGAAAVVSLRRLRQEFYGLPPDDRLLDERLLKESLHELGHTLGLRHCPDYSCVMSSSHAVENIDLKLPEFCPGCAGAADLR